MPILDIQAIRDILPHRYPMLLVDAIVELEEERIVGIKNVTINEPFFRGHFPGFPGDAGRPDRGGHGASGGRPGSEKHPRSQE